MKSYQLFFWFIVSITSVEALNTALPYELLHFYSAYKAEFKSVPAGSRKIATKCKHKENTFNADALAFQAEAAAAGFSSWTEGTNTYWLCNFDEFARHVGSNNWAKGWKADSVGSHLNPNPDDIAAKSKQVISSLGQANQKLVYKGSTMFPGETWTIAQISNPFKIPLPRLQLLVLNVLQTARAAAVADTTLSSFVTQCVDNSKIFLRLVNEYRIEDQMKWLLPELRGGAYSNGDAATSPSEMEPFKDNFATKNNEILGYDGNVIGSYDTPDWDKTFGDSTAATDAEKAAMINWSNNYGTTPGTIQKTHKDVMIYNDFSIDILSGNNLSCQSAIKRRRIQPASQSSSRKH